MGAATSKLVPIDRSMDGARILYRHFLSTRPPIEAYVREFSPDGKNVRVSRTLEAKDQGQWIIVYNSVCVAVLEPARPVPTKEDIDRECDRLRGLPDQTRDLGLEEEEG